MIMVPPSDTPPAHFAEGCCVSLVALAATMLHRRHMALSMRANTHFSLKRLLYSSITALAPALGLLNFLAVTSPRMHTGVVLAQHVVVAGVMACFMELLLLLCYRTSLVRGDGSERDVPGISKS